MRARARAFGFESATGAVAGAHGHSVPDFPLRDAIAKVVGSEESVSGSEVFAEFRQGRKQVWARAVWEEGDGARTGGDNVPAAVMRRSMGQPQGDTERQLELCEKEIAMAQPGIGRKAPACGRG